jgi:hypothetical protein
MTVDQIVLDPLLPWPVVWAAVALVLLAVALAAWRGLSGWWLRGSRGVALLAALLNPSLQEEEREPLTDIVVAVVDESASQRVSDRAGRSAEALAHLEAEVAARENTELRVAAWATPRATGGLARAWARWPRRWRRSRRVGSRGACSSPTGASTTCPRPPPCPRRSTRCSRGARATGTGGWL